MSIEVLYSIAILLMVPAFIFVAISQSKVHSTINQYSKYPSNINKPAHQVIADVLNAEIGTGKVNIRIGNSDHYNPKKKEIILTKKVYEGTSISAIGIALHEAGHALQDAKGYKPMKIRQAIAPIVSFGASFVWVFFIIGTALLVASYFAGAIMLYISIGLYALTTLFYLITYPVEKDASRRALAIAKQHQIFTDDELLGAEVVLRSAARTYLAALVMSMVELFRFILLALLYIKRD